MIFYEKNKIEGIMKNINLPINSNKLINDIGLYVIEQEFSEYIGFEIKDNYIIIPKNSTIVYKTFVFAYVYIMKKKFNMNEDKIVWKNDFNYPHYAYVQNKLLEETMDILIPNIALDVLIKQRKITNLNKLKSIFNVSLNLLKYKLKRKNYI